MSENTENRMENQELQRKPDYEKELISIIKNSRTPEEIREKIADYHDNDIAAVLEDLTPEERKRLYHILGVEAVSDIFAYLDDAEEYIEELEPEKAADILESMDADEAMDLLDDLSDQKQKELIRLMDEDSRKDIALISSFDEDEIGSRMTTNFVVINRNMTIRQAMKSLVEQAADNDNISTLYVQEKDGHFYGAIDLKELIIARENTNLEDLISTSYPYVYAQESVAECIEQLKDYSEDSIPVLNNDNQLIGAITSQDLIEVVDDEMSDDYAKLAGLTAEEDLKEPLGESMKKRIPWLIVLLGLGLVVSTVVGMFETVVAQLTLVVCFQSLILDMAGNVGTQSLAVTIRVLMDENLTATQKLGFAFKEMRVGFCNGFLLGILAFIFIGFYIYLIKSKTLLFSFAVSSCIGLALLLSMVISSLTGTVIPMFFKKIKVDPAVASGPLITTVNDLVAVVTYYGMTWILLINVLQLME